MFGLVHFFLFLHGFVNLCQCGNPFFSHLHRTIEGGFSCCKPSLSSDKKRKSPESVPVRGGLLSEVVKMRGFEKVFQPKVDKAAVAGSSRGHTSAARTDPSTHDPPDKQHFLSRALFFFFGLERFCSLRKAKAFKAKVNA